MNDINYSVQRNQRYNDFFERDIRDFRLTTTEALIWCCAWRHTRWEHGTFTLSYSRIAHQCFISELTVKRAIKKMNDIELIKRLWQGSGTASSVYALLDTEGQLLPQTVTMLQRRKHLVDNAAKYSPNDSDSHEG